MSSEPKVKRLLENLEQLFVQGQNSDIILKVEGREFPVHKGILTVRSPVFACMFNYDTKENASGVIVIPDCSAEAFEFVLQYLYTGKVDALCAENAFSIYYVADKYCIDDLKDHIVEFLKDNLSLENCCDVFSLSLRHSDLELQEMTAQFFSINIKKIVSTSEWRTFLREHHIEANALLKKTMELLKRT